jgi:voltage-gated potassium channel
VRSLLSLAFIQRNPTQRYRVSQRPRRWARHDAPPITFRTSLGSGRQRPGGVEHVCVEARTERWEARFAVPVMVAALATVPLLVLEQDHPHHALKTVVSAGNWVIWLVFVAEAAVLLAVTPSRLGWLRDHPVELVIIVFTAPFLSVAIPSLRLLRTLRLLRLLRLGPQARRLFSLDGLRYATLLALVALAGGAEAFAAAENVSVGNGVYWALTTMTTVGYGDVTPKTTTGKTIACVLMLVGIGFFALITGAIAQRFLSVEVEEVEDAIEEVESTETFVLREVRDIGERLRVLEAALERGSSPDRSK